MKNTITAINERRDQIISLIDTNRTISVNELAKILNVTSVTIRKDLDALALEEESNAPSAARKKSMIPRL